MNKHKNIYKTNRTVQCWTMLFCTANYMSFYMALIDHTVFKSVIVYLCMISFSFLLFGYLSDTVKILKPADPEFDGLDINEKIIVYDFVTNSMPHNIITAFIVLSIFAMSISIILHALIYKNIFAYIMYGLLFIIILFFYILNLSLIHDLHVMKKRLIGKRTKENK